MAEFGKTDISSIPLVLRRREEMEAFCRAASPLLRDDVGDRPPDVELHEVIDQLYHILQNPQTRAAYDSLAENAPRGAS